MTKQLHLLSIRKLFTNRHFRIPLYQRGYRWTETEIRTLLQDVQLAQKQNSENYYLGSLVTQRIEDSRQEAAGQIYYEVVDGQQRLTTLFIILKLIDELGKDPELSVQDDALQYDSHRTSVDFLLNLISGEETTSAIDDEGNSDENQDISKKASEADTPYLKEAVETCKKALDSEQNPGHSSRSSDEINFNSDDIKYLLYKTKILLIELPKQTDLNHYFEIMNTRGTQLEKHEVLKARLMGVLPESSQADFEKIWNACANFDQPINRLGTGPQEDLPQEDLLNRLCHLNKLQNEEEKNAHQPEDGGTTTKLSSILRGENALSTKNFEGQSGKIDNEEELANFTPIIDFPNFLLHALYVKRMLNGEGNPDMSEASVSIPSSQNLLEEFPSRHHNSGTHKSSELTASWVVDFVNLLFKMRVLFDQNIVYSSHTGSGPDDYRWEVGHRDSEKEDQAVTDLHTHIIILQSMFQVTFTPRTSKNFLFRYLHWLVKEFNKQFNADGKADAKEERSSGWLGIHAGDTRYNLLNQDFLKFLQELADEYFPLTSVAELNRGTGVPNYVFNYLDYSLWRIAKGNLKSDKSEWNNKQLTKQLKSAIKNFRFRYRSSVEHFYPQNPSNHILLPREAERRSASSRHSRQDEHRKIVDQFGNLCLMTRSENSRRSNLVPEAKSAEYKKDLSSQSLKFQLMNEENKEWGEEQIERHGEDMLRVLKLAGIALGKETSDIVAP